MEKFYFFLIRIPIWENISMDSDCIICPLPTIKKIKRRDIRYLNAMFDIITLKDVHTGELEWIYKENVDVA